LKNQNVCRLWDVLFFVGPSLLLTLPAPLVDEAISNLEPPSVDATPSDVLDALRNAIISIPPLKFESVIQVALRAAHAAPKKPFDLKK
jgi:hypothetical protein